MGDIEPSIRELLGGPGGLIEFMKQIEEETGKSFDFGRVEAMKYFKKQEEIRNNPGKGFLAVKYGRGMVATGGLYVHEYCLFYDRTNGVALNIEPVSSLSAGGLLGAMINPYDVELADRSRISYLEHCIREYELPVGNENLKREGELVFFHAAEIVGNEHEDMKKVMLELAANPESPEAKQKATDEWRKLKEAHEDVFKRELLEG